MSVKGGGGSPGDVGEGIKKSWGSHRNEAAGFQVISLVMQVCFEEEELLINQVDPGECRHRGRERHPGEWRGHREEVAGFEIISSVI